MSSASVSPHMPSHALHAPVSAKTRRITLIIPVSVSRARSSQKISSLPQLSALLLLPLNQRQTDKMPSPGTHSTTQLITTAAVSGAVVASVILGYQRIRREKKVDHLKHSIPDLDTSRSEQLNDFGLVSPAQGHLSKEDERSAMLAQRALRGDYDEGVLHQNLQLRDT